MAEICAKGLKGMYNKVTSSSSECLQWIDAGVLQLFNFNHDQAIIYFQKALSYDPDCAMAHFFLAYSNGGYYNNLGGVDYAIGYEESQKALSLSHNTDLFEWEVALIEAQTQRFCYPVGSVKLDTLNRNYAKAMRSVYHSFGESIIEVAIFFAESLMSLAPWKLWTPSPEYKPAIAETLELVSVLESGLSKYPKHPQLCHIYIHTMELSATPEKALPYADALRNTIIEHGHLLHMASHIDMWVGQYNEAVEVNELAILADKRYMLTSSVENNFYKAYRLHNYQFAVWAGMFNGQFGKSMHYAECMSDSIDKDAISCMHGDYFPIGKMYLEPMKCSPWEVLVRFGKWNEILERAIEPETKLYPSVSAMCRYARAVAYAALGRVENAELERDLFNEALKDRSLATRFLMNNAMYNPKNPGRCILDIAQAIINGEIEYRKANYKLAFEHLRLAVKRDSNLLYAEPWSWLMPSRHVLGALLMEHGEVVEAEKVYREDLLQYKNNMWSLLGLFQSLRAQNRYEEASTVYASYQKASSYADVKVGASCMCATQIST